MSSTSNAAAASFIPVSEVPALVSEVRACFDSGKTRSLEWRRAQLDGIARFLQERRDELFAALAEDLGRSAVESHIADVATTLSEVKLASKMLGAWTKPERVSTPLAIQPGKSTIVRQPLGVALIIGPWNYPLNLVAIPLVGAIAAGNCAIVKPSEISAATSSLLAEQLPEYVDPECVRVVEGGVEETTALLAQRFDHIFYTGNGTVGRIVMAAAAKHLTPVTLELGGKSPCLVDAQVDLEVAARRIIWGKFFNAGQTCVAPDYVLAHEAIHDRLLEELAAVLPQFYGADPKASPDFARVVNRRHFERLYSFLADGKLVAGGTTDASERYIAPTILEGVEPDAPVMQEEIFGPILPVLKIRDLDEGIRFVNERPKPLALYVFSSSRDHQQRVLDNTSSGGATVNHVWLHLGPHELPFGGVGESGMGAYHGRHTFETFSHRRAVLRKGFTVDPSLAYPPYTEARAKWLRRLW
jgi:aldehyde dehydrogenase (NAD+)